MANAAVLKTAGGNPLRVRVPSPAPNRESSSGQVGQAGRPVLVLATANAVRQRAH